MSDHTEGRPRAALAVIGGVVAVLVVIIGSFILFGGGDDDANSADPGGSTPSSSPGDSDTDGDTATGAPADPPPSVPYEKEARKAGRDGFPALVPTDLPAGWTVTSATYTAGDKPSWQLELLTGQGDTVTVQQAEADLDAMVEQAAPGATEGDSVNLNRWQTGTWRSWSGDGAEALGKEMKATTVVLVSTDRTSAISTAKRLLTIETTDPVVGD